LARQIIGAVCDNTSLPVSLKIRAGVKKHTAVDFINDIKDLPFAAVMVHGRTYEGSFHGPVDFALVAKIKKLIPDKIVLANGGINTPEDAREILQKYPTIDGLGIARGAWGRPYIFDEIKNSLCDNSTDAINRVSITYDFKAIKKIMLRHAKLIWQDKKDVGMFEIRKHLAWYIRGFPGAAELRRELVQAKSVAEIKNILKKN
jgi:tRNA-dihydrouridine synthase